MQKIIDVSYHNGAIDFNAVRDAGIEGVIIRAGYGKNNIDTRYAENIKAAIAAGLPVGVYWFSYAYSIDMAVKEAEYCLTAISPYKLDLPVFFDWEYDSMRYAKECGETPDKGLITDMCAAFCSRIEKDGYTAGVYYNLDYRRNRIDTDALTKYKVWYARYENEPGYTCDLWQYTSKGSVSGVSSKNVDQNYLMNEDILRKEEGGPVMIANCGHDEKGNYKGGKAGDQTGDEWEIIKWYSRPWNVVLRFEDPATAGLIATLAEEAARNDKIGYDQGQRLTFWKELRMSGFRPKNISTACETDCSAGVLAICKAVGYILGNEKMEDINEAGYTGNERKILKAAGAVELTASKYLTSDKYLKRGDILLYEGHHTAINLTNGSAVSGSTTKEVTDTVMPMIKNGSKGKAVFVWQAILGFKGSDYDGDFGAYTLRKTKEFQKSKGLDADGIVGPKTWKAGFESV